MQEVQNPGGGVVIKGVFYPDWVGDRMGESLWHGDALFGLYAIIQDLFRNRRDVLIAGDVPWFYEEGNPSAVRAPDIMVIKGVSVDANLRSYASFDVGVVPCFILEIASKSSYRTDQDEKVPQYTQLGVREVFLFDPEGEYLPVQLMGFRRSESGESVRIEQGEHGFWSEELESWVCQSGRYIRLRDQNGDLRLNPSERAEAEHDRAEAEHERAETEKERAEAEKERADRLAAEVARLRASLGLPPETSSAQP